MNDLKLHRSTLIIAAGVLTTCVGGFLVYTDMHHDEHTITTQSYDMPIAQSADGRLYNDDFEEDVAGFLTMSYEDIDTTEIDFKILTRYEEILKNDPAYTTLTTDQYVERLTQLCEPYPDMCTKIVRKHDYTPRQYYMYTLFTIHLITQIDKNIKIDVPPLRDTIASIKFVQNTREPRGRAGSRHVLINTQEMRTPIEAFEIMTHEIAGHIFDFGVLVDHGSAADPSFDHFGKKFGKEDFSLRFYNISRETDKIRRRSAREKHFISGYASSNPYEEFAEHVNAWINHQTPLLELSRKDPILLKKYMLLRELFGKRYINADIDTYKTLKLDHRPYDTTRWHG